MSKILDETARPLVERFAQGGSELQKSMQEVTERATEKLRSENASLVNALAARTAETLSAVEGARSTLADSVAAGVIPKNEADNLVIVCGVFIHPEAKDDNKIYQYNYEATKMAIKNAMKGEPKIDEILAKKDTAKHPFSPK